MVLKVESKPCVFDGEFKILYLFFKEKNQIFMLLGRDEITEEKEGSDESSFKDSEITYDYIDNSQNDEV